MANITVGRFGGVVNAMPCYWLRSKSGISFGSVCSNHTGVVFCS